MTTLSRAMLSGLILTLLCGAQGCFSLPEGTPPEGAIVTNPVVSEKLSRQEMVLALGSRLAASAMEYFPGGPVAVEADAGAAETARAAVAEAGKICGVRLEFVAAAVLAGKRQGAVFEFELFHFSRSLWRCRFEVTNP